MKPKVKLKRRFESESNKRSISPMFVVQICWNCVRLVKVQRLMAVVLALSCVLAICMLFYAQSLKGAASTNWKQQARKPHDASSINDKPILARQPAPAVPHVCEVSMAAKNSANGTLIEIPSVLGSTRISKLHKPEKHDEKILLLLETAYSAAGRHLCQILDALKFPYKIEVLRKRAPNLTTENRRKFSLIIIENYYKYLNMDNWNRQLLDKYCRDYGVGLIGFLTSKHDKKYTRAKVRTFPMQIRQHQQVRSVAISSKSTMLRVAKRGQNVTVPTVDRDWLVFEPEHSAFESVVDAQLIGERNTGTEKLPVVLLDRGQLDGIKRLWFGCSIRFWLAKLILLDGIDYMTDGRASLPIERYLQIDIDDIFVGATGTRMVEDDVLELIDRQERWRKEYISGFTFTLGFSGQFFRNGNAEENRGDEALIENADKFRWFPHMWRHQQPHEWNSTQLVTFGMLNRQFAQNYHLSLDWQYAVAPHHSGVYPVHEPLYDAWHNVYDIRVTSTEQYPHMQPASKRRGFVHRNVMVLPRQTCGLWTHTQLLHLYPGGPEKLHELVLGGELFQTFLFNPFLVFMTHQGNYAHDRLALYTFEMMFQFLKCWTNLKLRSATPLEIAKMYFDAYPSERKPIWTNPCLDARHSLIWSPDNTCSRLPQALVIGPQKTGTTALHLFMSQHPLLTPSVPSNTSFEEVQFFGSNNYLNGLKWYMSFFEPNSVQSDDRDGRSGTEAYFFEKSATYFDVEDAPRQVHALMPDVKLIVIMMNPIDRAYSWYQHQRAKHHPIASSYSFDDVVHATVDSAQQDLWHLHQRCVNPGKYAHHIERWMEYFSPGQIHIVDGDELRTRPAQTMDLVQKFLALAEIIDYEPLLKFNERKGFHCLSVMSANDNRRQHKCLGAGKGRQYEPMSVEARSALSLLYRQHSVALYKLLTRISRPIPAWLKGELENVQI